MVLYSYIQFKQRSSYITTSNAEKIKSSSLLDFSSYSTSELSNNASKRSIESAILMFSFVLLFVFSRETWKMMALDGFAQKTGKYCSIRHIEYPKFQTRIFGRMESAPGYVLLTWETAFRCVQETLNLTQV